MWHPDYDGETVACPECDGHGLVRWCPDDTVPGAGYLTDVCEICRGAGRITAKVAQRRLHEIDDVLKLDMLDDAIQYWRGEKNEVLLPERV